jgi:hypothetical protein
VILVRTTSIQQRLNFLQCVRMSEIVLLVVSFFVVVVVVLLVLLLLLFDPFAHF